MFSVTSRALNNAEICNFADSKLSIIHSNLTVHRRKKTTFIRTYREGYHKRISRTRIATWRAINVCKSALYINKSNYDSIKVEQTLCSSYVAGSTIYSVCQFSVFAQKLYHQNFVKCFNRF